MVFNSATVESVEFNASSGLLVIRNPILSEEQEHGILQSNGWTEAAESDLPEEGLPPTPRLKGSSLFGRESNKLKRGVGAGGRKSADSEGMAEEGRASSDSTTGAVSGSEAGGASFGGNKRVYKPAVTK